MCYMLCNEGISYVTAFVAYRMQVLHFVSSSVRFGDLSQRGHTPVVRFPGSGGTGSTTEVKGWVKGW